jgi:L-amino acid N-acyltransferase YncA
VEAEAVAVSIEAMKPGDWPAVRAIYQEGIETGDATFELDAPTWEAWDASRLPDHRLVARNESGTVVGWTAVSPVSDRCVYEGVVESAIYVAPEARGRGVGTALLRALVEGTEAHGIWTIQTGIFPENAASLRLHEACGFRVVGVRERVGKHRGRWRDVVFVERRSPAID